MGYIETFDDFNSSAQANLQAELAPFPFREDKSKEGTHNWLIQNFDQKERAADSRIRNYRRWSNLYKGIHHSDSYTRSQANDYGYDDGGSKNKPKMVDNMIWEFLDIKVSQMSRLGVNVACIPWNDESSDTINAKSCDKLLSARFTDMNFKKLQDDADLLKFKYGTVAQYYFWNPKIGPIDPLIKRLNQLFPKGIPKKYLKKLKNPNLRIGDVDMVNICPWQIFPQIGKKDWKHVDELDMLSDPIHVEELKAMYPDKKDIILEEHRPIYDMENNTYENSPSFVRPKHFFHRKTDFLPEGAHIIYTDYGILEWKSLEFFDGELPFVIDRDIEIEKELFGRPKLINIEQTQRQTNNIESAIGRDLGAGSAPKWLFPKGAVSFKSANNGFSIMEYKGQREPKLIQNNPVSQQALAKLERNEQKMAKKMKVYDISRGIVPPGIEANSALRFLDEQEDNANEPDKNKRKDRVVAGARKMMSIMAAKYTAEDNRTIRILGANKQYAIENLKDADFTKVYDVTIQNTSALPDSKSGKISTIIDMNAVTQNDPAFKPHQIVKLLDLGDDETFIDRTTASTNTAEAIFEDILKGREVMPPSEGDDLLIYYNVFYQRTQDYGYKTKVAPEIKEQVKAYIMALEYLITNKAKVNQRLAAELAQLDYYPIYFKPFVPDPVQPDYVGEPAEANLKPVQDRMEQQQQQN